MLRTISYIVMMVIILVPFGTGHAIAGEATENIPITPNKEVQSFLHSMAHRLASTNLEERLKFLQERLGLSQTATEEEFRDKLAAVFKQMAGQDKDLVLQLMYFHAHAKGEREIILPAVILEQLAIPDSLFAEVCLPMLDSEDESTRKMGSKYLTRADRNPQGGVDFSRYENILREKKEDPPEGLIRYMYWRDPQAAVLSMAQVYGDKIAEAEFAEKLKGDWKAVLQSRADRPEWWVRLYVAETMNKYPHLRDPAILKNLEKDDNPLVKEKVAEITSGK